MTKAQVGIYRINTEDDAETSQIDVVVHLGVFTKAEGTYPTYQDVADFTKALEDFVEQYNQPKRDYSLLKEALHELNNKPCGESKRDYYKELKQARCELDNERCKHAHTTHIEPVSDKTPAPKYCVDCGAELGTVCAHNKEHVTTEEMIQNLQNAVKKALVKESPFFK